MIKQSPQVRLRLSEEAAERYSQVADEGLTAYVNRLIIEDAHRSTLENTNGLHTELKES